MKWISIDSSVDRDTGQIAVSSVCTITDLPLICSGFGCYFAPPNSSGGKIVRSPVGGTSEKQKRFECNNTNCGIEPHRLISSEHEPGSPNRSARDSRLVIFHTFSPRHGLNFCELMGSCICGSNLIFVNQFSAFSFTI